RCRLHVVAGAALVAGAPFGRTPLGLGGRAPALSGDGTGDSERQRGGDTEGNRAHGDSPLAAPCPPLGPGESRIPGVPARVTPRRRSRAARRRRGAPPRAAPRR